MAKPMFAILGSTPFDSKDWVFEIKFDGYRAIAEIGKGEAAIYSRNQKSLNEKFSEIADELKKIGLNAVLDGEIVIIDKSGKNNFQLLQNYPNILEEGQLVYYIFDILSLDGKNLENLSLEARKKTLNDNFKKFETRRIKLAEFVSEKGKQVFELAEKMGFEGIIAKKKNSAYKEGIRSRDWVKIKIINQEEAIICGFTEPAGGGRKIGALILGMHKNDALIYIGSAGTGFSEASAKVLREKLEKIEIKNSVLRNPPKIKNVHWVKPELVAEVKFAEWTEDGKMRQSVFTGLRDDKSAEEIIFPKIPLFAKKGEHLQKEATRQIKFSNLDKIFWPEKGYRKKDLIEYYDKIAPFILPYLKGRPISLHRFPDGIYGEAFYQKNADSLAGIPDWIETAEFFSESKKKKRKYIICNHNETLLYLANLGCVEMHVWNSRADNPDKPDYLVLDLDPLEIEFARVAEAALAAKEILDKLELKSFCKTSGATGLHIYIPMGAKYSYKQIQQFAEILSVKIYKKTSDFSSLERSPGKRKGKVYIDIWQNARSQTMASPYSLRPVSGALVSAPLKWKEVSADLTPEMFDIESIFERVEEHGDIWSGFFEAENDIERSLEMINTQLTF